MRPTKNSLAQSDMKEITKAFHYLVSTENKKCVDITREFLEKHKKLIAVFANLIDDKGRKAINIALPKQRQEIQRFLYICGRYRLDPRYLVHRSETCEVLFAVDVESKTPAYPDGRPVALKMMKHRSQWESEIRRVRIINSPHRPWSIFSRGACRR